MQKQIAETLISMSRKTENERAVRYNQKGNRKNQILPFYFAALLILNIRIFASLLLRVPFAHLHRCVACSALQTFSKMAFAHKECFRHDLSTLCKPVTLAPLQTGKQLFRSCQIYSQEDPHPPKVEDYDFQGHFAPSTKQPLQRKPAHPSPYPLPFQSCPSGLCHS